MMNQVKVDLIRPEIRQITPYNAGLSLAEVRARFDVSRIAKLGSNENPAMPSGQVHAAVTDEIAHINLYPDASASHLRRALARYLGVDEGQLFLGNGSEDLLSVIACTTLRPGDRVVTLYPSFPLHEDYARAMGADLVRVPLTPDLEINEDALVAAIRKPTRMLLFSNPMNPVGEWLRPEGLKRILGEVAPETLVVLDEAYFEYAAGGDYVSAAEMDNDLPENWTVLRTFSKAWGLAGLRIGYGWSGTPELVEYINRMRTPFNVNHLAQIAAKAAMEDPSFVESSVALMNEMRAELEAYLSHKNIRFAQSRGNFLFIETPRKGVDVALDLLQRGVVVKPWTQEGYETFIRVSTGSVEDNAQLLKALNDVGL